MTRSYLRMGAEITPEERNTVVLFQHRTKKFPHSSTYLRTDSPGEDNVVATGEG
jgi:hypothetical protein